MDLRSLSGMQRQMAQPKIDLSGTTERITKDGVNVKIENVAYDKEGKEIVVRTIDETVEGLEKRKEALGKQKEALIARIDAEINKLNEILQVQ